MIANLLAQTTRSLTGDVPWLPPRASTVAGDVDWLLNFILAITVFFSILILALMVGFVLKYRHRPGHKAVPSAGHSTALELTWTIIPTILVVVIFFYGFRGYLNMIVVPPNTYEIKAEGYTWGWAFTYPNGYVDSNLHVPANTPVRIVLTSRDVIHALYIPSLRVQKMNTPGRYNRMWFEAKWVNEDKVNQPTADGQPYTEQHEIFCNMYCGQSHSEMLATLYVHKPEDFPAWLEKASDPLQDPNFTPVGYGLTLHAKAGCVQCHSLDGTAGTGPTWKDLWGKEGEFADGTKYKADENYIRESILRPDLHIVKGYGNAMPSYAGQLKDVDIDSLIAYLKSISKNWDGGDPNTGFPHKKAAK